MKILNLIRTITFIATLLTTVPLFIHYVSGNAPALHLIVHLHVWFGLAFFVFALMSMILTKRSKHDDWKS